MSARTCGLVIGCLAMVLFSCEGKRDAVREQVTATQAPVSLLEPMRLGEALKALIDPLPAPIRILSVKAYHRQVILQVQAAEDPTLVVEYRYKDGAVTKPTQVTLLGAGKLQDNLFPLQAANPQIASKVIDLVASEYKDDGLRLKKLVMIRNLPRSRDIQFQVFLENQDGVLLVKADKNGRLLGEPEPAEQAGP